MLVPTEQLIDGVIRTLLESVLPDVTTRFARGQLYAAVDVLRNLRDRVEPKAELLEAESTSAAAALERRRFARRWMRRRRRLPPHGPRRSAPRSCPRST
jgi:hypothetical protein